MPKRADSTVLVDWIFWMVRDILESRKWKIVVRYAYVDTDSGKNLALTKVLSERETRGKKYERIDAFVDMEEYLICVSFDAENRALCLFHECLEVLFSDWKDDYFDPERWGLSSDDDPILSLESATWDHLTEEQKDVIASFLPCRPKRP